MIILCKIIFNKYRRAAGSNKKDFLTKEEFMIFIFNNTDLLKYLLKRFKKDKGNNEEKKIK